MKKDYLIIINFPTRDLQFEVEFTIEEAALLYEDMIVSGNCKFVYKDGSCVIPKTVLENNPFQLIRK